MKKLLLLLIIVFSLVACQPSDLLDLPEPTPDLGQQLQTLLPTDWNVVEVVQWSQQAGVVAYLADDTPGEQVVDGLLEVLRWAQQFQREITEDDPEVALVIVWFVDPSEECESGWVNYGALGFQQQLAVQFLAFAEDERDVWVENPTLFSMALQQYGTVQKLSADCYEGVRIYEPPIAEMDETEGQ